MADGQVNWPLILGTSIPLGCLIIAALLAALLRRLWAVRQKLRRRQVNATLYGTDNGPLDDPFLKQAQLFDLENMHPEAEARLAATASPQKQKKKKLLVPGKPPTTVMNTPHPSPKCLVLVNVS